MSIKILRYFLVIFALATFVTCAKAQFLWQETHVGSDWRYEYSFTALSCKESNCTAAGILVDWLKWEIRLVFWRSNDGGATWNMQDPELPLRAGQNSNQFFAIQQIDAKNVVATADSGLIVRTFDGGKTWEQQDCHTLAYLGDVHFSDPMTGIVTSYDSLGAIYTTTDGGRNWDTHSINSQFLGHGHSYGNGKFRVFKQGNGPIYSTNDNWKTIDSTKLLIDSTKDSLFKNYYFNKCNFGRGDTMFAYGDYNLSGNGADGLVMRSINGGISWEAPIRIHKQFFYEIFYMSSADQDTILAVSNGSNHFIKSFDHGMSWNVDSLMLDSNYTPYYPSGLASAGGKNFVAAFSSGGYSGILMRTGPIQSEVKSYTPLSSASAIFPNPAISEFNISGLIQEHIQLIDILGRKVMEGKTSADGKCTFDVRSLPRGIYNIVKVTDGVAVSVGKIALATQ